MGERRGAYRVLVGKSERLGRLRHSWEDNIKVNLWEVGLGGRGGLDRIDQAQDRNKWRTLVNAVMNLRVP
jgi:hypothetical protein